GTVQQPLAIVLEGEADPALAHSAEQTEIALNGTFEYVVRVSNPSTEVATNVVLRDTISAASDVVSVSGTARFDGGTRTIEQAIAVLQPVEEREVTLQLQAFRVGTHRISIVSITANIDSDASNNRGQPVAIHGADSRADGSRLFIPGLFTPNGDG